MPNGIIALCHSPNQIRVKCPVWMEKNNSVLFQKQLFGLSILTSSLSSVHLFFTSPMRSNSLSDLENIFDSINDLKLVIFTFRFRSLFERRSMVPVTFSIRCTFDSELSLWSKRSKKFA